MTLNNNLLLQSLILIPNMDKKIGFVFDLDGTLINSTDIGKIIEKEVYKEFNIQTDEKMEKEIEELTYEIMHGENHKHLGTKLMWALFKKVGLSFFQRIKALKLANRIFREEIPKIKLFEGTQELIQFLDENSEYSPQMEKALVEILAKVCKDKKFQSWKGFEHYCKVYLRQKQNEIPMLKQTLISIKNRIRRFSHGPLRSLFETGNIIKIKDLFNKNIATTPGNI